MIRPCLAGLEAEAAIAERALAARDTAAHDAARARADDLVERVRDAARGPVSEPVRAMAQTAEAHRSRATGRSNPHLWATAADAWEALGHPCHAAYARWRQTEALLNSGISKDQAATVLRTAHALGSAKTASVHVSNILAKLGVANRAEAAVAAHRLGLADA